MTTTANTPNAAATPAATAGTTILLAFLIMILEGFDIQAMGVAAPKLGPELHLAKDILGQVLAASNIGLVIGAVFGGWLADRLGRKPVLIGAVLTFGLFTLVTAAAHRFDFLFAARLGAGLGFGAALPNVMAMAAEVSPAKSRGLAGSAMFCGMPVGGAVVALTSWLGADSDWRSLFIIGGALPLVLAALAAWLMREPHAERTATAPRRVRPDALLGIGLLAIYVVGLLTLRWAGDLPGLRILGSMGPWLAILPALLAGYLVVHRKALFAEDRAAPSLLLWIIFLPTLLILYLILNWLPTLVAAKGFARDASLASVFFNASSVAGALILGRLVDRFGLRWPLSLAYLGLIAALMALAYAQGHAAVLALSGAVGFFVLGANYALYGAAASYYPAAVRGRGSGAAIAWGRLGSVAGPMVGGFLLQGGAGAGSVVAAMAPFAVVAGLGVVALSIFAKPVN